MRVKKQMDISVPESSGTHDLLSAFVKGPCFSDREATCSFHGTVHWSHRDAKSVLTAIFLGICWEKIHEQGTT